MIEIRDFQTQTKSSSLSARLAPFIPVKCGSKEAVIVRLLAHRKLRLKLTRFTDNPEELANSYQRESLRDMCREARIWRSGNKRALAAGLPELARSVPRARPSVFSRNAIAGERPAATAIFPLLRSVLTEELLTFYPCAARESLTPG